MKRSWLGLVIAIGICPLAEVYGQGLECLCRDYLQDVLRPADTVIQVAKEFQIAACGYRQQQDGHTYFSEFTLYECGRPAASMGEWGATEECLLHRTDSSLVVEELGIVPQGSALELRSVPCWRTEFIRSESMDGNVMITVNRTMVVQLPKPTPAQATRFENEFGSTSYPDEQLIAHLFLCAAYDLNGWRERFRALRNTGKLDGAVAEYHTELAALLEEIPEDLK